MNDDETKLRAFEAIVVLIMLVLIFVLLVLSVWPTCATAAIVIITDETGALVKQCVSPIELVPDSGAVICRTPTQIYLDGFE